MLQCLASNIKLRLKLLKLREGEEELLARVDAQWPLYTYFAAEIMKAAGVCGGRCCVEVGVVWR